MIPYALLAAVIGYMYYASPGRSRRPGAMPHPHGGLAGPVPGLQPGHHGHHHHRHEGMPVVAPPTKPAWLEPGMPQSYAQAVWQAYYFEQDPRNLHAFGDRLHEASLHHAGDALHGRASAIEMRHHHGL
jgi:hypothetical protein